MTLERGQGSLLLAGWRKEPLVEDPKKYILKNFKGKKVNTFLNSK